jgi:hypothetical protein
MGRGAPVSGGVAASTTDRYALVEKSDRNFRVADNEECVRQAACRLRTHLRAQLSLTSLNGMVEIGLLRCLSAANIERRTSQHG